jgi:TolB-like protein
MRILTVASTWCLAATACASNPAARRAVLIADADRAAKDAVAAESRLDVAKIPARSVAVLPFTVNERDTLLTPLGYGLAELLSTDLAVSPRLVVVERLRIGAILRELKLVDEGVTDPRGAPRVGRLIGARRLLIGSITPAPGNAVRLQARVLDAVAGTVDAELTAADVPVSRIIDAEKSLAVALFERLGVTLTPAQLVAVEQRQTTQLAALVAFGRGAEADTRGDAAGATAAFAEAARLDASFTVARAHVSSPSSVSRVSSVQRVVALTNQALNQPAGAHLSEAGDAALAASLSVPVVVTVRVVP